jgi:hypothetical protein
MAQDTRQRRRMVGFDLAALATWSIDKIGSNWGAIVQTMGGGVLMGALAWVQGLPPLAWGGAFLVGLIVMAIFRLINAASYMRRALAKYAEKHADTSSVNPLRKDFQDNQINLRDFYHPYQQSGTNLSFRNCELFGPNELFLHGEISFRTVCHFQECTTVIIKDQQPLFGAVKMKDVSFSDCRFFRVTILVTAKDARGLKSIIPFGNKGLPIISDGTYGEEI